MKYYVWAERLTDYYWSSPFTKLRDALEEAKDVLELKDGDTVYIMKGEFADIPYFSIDNIIEDMQESAYDEAGEAADSYLNDLTVEDTLELEDLIKDTIRKFFKKKHYMPNWYNPDYYKEFILVGGKWSEVRN